MFCSDGTLLSVSVFPNARARSRLLVSHGNGLASFGYRTFWEPLREHFEVIAFDMRGHGGSEPGDLAMHNIAQFTDDLQSVLGALSATDPRPLVGAFHSLSAIVSLLHLAKHPGSKPWQALLLFDPPVAGPPGNPLERQHHVEMTMLAKAALRRRSTYASVDERVAQFMRADVFGTWQPGAPLDMAIATLRPDRGADTWHLSCDPDREAFIYKSNTDMEGWRMLASPPCPIKLIGGDPYRAKAESPSKVCLLAHEATGVRYDFVPDTGHFLQMEQPARCRELLLAFVHSVA